MKKITLISAFLSSIIITSFAENNADKENLNYLLKDSNTKFPISDYIWQKEKPKQNINDYFNKQQTNTTNINVNKSNASKANITLVGYDEFGNPIYMDSEGNLVDSNGNLILDSQGKPIKVRIGKDGKPILVDSNGNLVDSKGKLVLDSNRKPIKVAVDKNGNAVLLNSQNNIVDNKGNLILDSQGKPIKALIDKNGEAILIDSKGNTIDNAKFKMLLEKHKIEQELNKAKNKSNQSTNTQITKKPTTKPNTNKTNNKAKANIDMEALFLEAMEKNPLLAEYGDDELNNSELQGIDKLIADSLLFSDDSSQKNPSLNKYGDSSFSNQENIDIATNEHRLYRTITAGKLIPCILLTPINSEIEGLVSAQVEQDIYAQMGRAVLIPRGSKVIGFYKNDNEVGQARIQIVWREIITPKGVNIILTNAVAGDSEGYAGAKGYLNNRYWQRYGMALSLQTLANSITFGIANATQKENTGAGTGYYMGQILAQGQSDVNNALKQVLSKQMNIKPIIQIMAGSRIYITPTTHIWFPIPKNNEVMAKYFE